MKESRCPISYMVQMLEWFKEAAVRASRCSGARSRGQNPKGRDYKALLRLSRLVTNLSASGIYCPDPGATNYDRAGVKPTSPPALACLSRSSPFWAAREGRSYETEGFLCGTSVRLQEPGLVFASFPS